MECNQWNFDSNLDSESKGDKRHAGRQSLTGEEGIISLKLVIKGNFHVLVIGDVWIL